LGIAQAQINYPDLLILDEPAASLDPMGRHDVIAAFDGDRHDRCAGFNGHDEWPLLERSKLASAGPCALRIDQKGMALLQLPHGLLHAADGLHSVLPVDENESSHFHDQSKQGQLAQFLLQDEPNVPGNGRKQGRWVAVALVIGKK